MLNTLILIVIGIIALGLVSRKFMCRIEAPEFDDIIPEEVIKEVARELESKVSYYKECGSSQYQYEVDATKDYDPLIISVFEGNVIEVIAINEYALKRDVTELWKDRLNSYYDYGSTVE